MKIKEKKRRLKYLMSTILPLNSSRLRNHYKKESELLMAFNIDSSLCQDEEHVDKTTQIFIIAHELEIKGDDIFIMWETVFKERMDMKDLFKGSPLKEGRDNKGVYVGSSGSNRTKVRYPSKKRSNRTWKIFYKMFPLLAEKDEWDGVTSKRMKK